MRWLTAAEVDSWLSVVRLMTWLPWSIDQQLRRDSNLGMVEYQVLAMLSESRDRTMRMSSLAEVTNASLSRLSHLVELLEAAGATVIDLGPRTSRVAAYEAFRPLPGGARGDWFRNTLAGFWFRANNVPASPRPTVTTRAAATTPAALPACQMKLSVISRVTISQAATEPAITPNTAVASPIIRYSSA